MRRLVLMLVSLVFEASLLLPGALTCAPNQQNLGTPYYQNDNCTPPWPYNDYCAFTKNQPWTIVWPGNTDHITLSANGGRGYSRNCSGIVDGMTVCWPNFREPEERELEKVELDDLSAKITEAHTLTKERSKSGWLGFTVYDLDLPLDTQTRQMSEQNEEGEYVVYEIEEPIGVRTDTIKELALSVTDGYGQQETRIIKGPFRKYGKRIRSRRAL